jgi:hypothetical protein
LQGSLRGEEAMGTLRSLAAAINFSLCLRQLNRTEVTEAGKKAGDGLANANLLRQGGLLPEIFPI